MSDQLSALNLFVRVAHTGNFSRAARDHNLSQPTASRIIASLEQHLGVTLFSRTTRAVTLTEAGDEYLTRVLQILGDLEEAEHMVRGTGELRGTLKIGIPSTFASRAVLPRLSGFLERHPALRLEMQVADGRQDLIAEGIDVALRFGPIEDSCSRSRRIGAWPMIVVAGSRYLTARGEPLAPADLAAHDIITCGPQSSTRWSFSRDGRRTSVDLDARMRLSDGETAIHACIAGHGVLAGFGPSLQHELASGRLTRVLPAWMMNDLEVYALFPGGQMAKPSARAFTEYLMVNLADI